MQVRAAFRRAEGRPAPAGDARPLRRQVHHPETRSPKLETRHPKPDPTDPENRNPDARNPKSEIRACEIRSPVPET